MGTDYCTTSTTTIATTIAIVIGLVSRITRVTVFAFSRPSDLAPKSSR
ncbi:MAG: hypothetical protein VKI42_09025 [Synechococcaceae cyanobacterium]|nr:hypothetical protein [Synechococcaceae cyanobacterium]